MTFHFAEHMRSIVDAIHTSAHDRTVALDEIRSQTEQCLSNARDSLQKTAENQRERRAAVRQELDSFRKERQEMRTHLRDSLAAGRTARKATVSEMLEVATQARTELKTALAEAAAVWHGMNIHAGTPAPQRRNRVAKK